MMHNHTYSEEGRLRKANKFNFTLILIAAIFTGITAGYAVSYFVHSNLTPYQRLYYPQFRLSFVKQFVPLNKQGRYILLTHTLTDQKTKKTTERLWLESQIDFDLDESGKIKFDDQSRPIFRVKPGVVFEPNTTSFVSTMRSNAEVYKVLSDTVYQSEYYEFLYLPLIAGFVAFLSILFLGCAILNKSIRKRLKGVFKRGMHSSSVKEYQKLYKNADGFSIAVSDPNRPETFSMRFRRWTRSLFANGVQTDALKIPRADETKGTLILGDSGTGKTVLLHQIIECARSPERREPGICYDPASEFVQSHYRHGKDFILNPFDERFPNWELCNEVRTVADLDLIAESFFPSRFTRDPQSKFFNSAAQDIFKLVLAKKYNNQKTIEVIGNPAMLDKLVAGTEFAHYIDPKAGPQRAGVLASLASIGKILRFIPAHREGTKNFSLTGWANANRHQSWLFFTMTAETRDSLRPFASAMLNILMKRLMSISNAQRRNDAWWFIADELHTLNSLSALPEFVAECRKHGIRYVFGTQSKHQIISQYGEEGRAVLAQPKLKIFYRCNESETATWVSQNVGNQELDLTKISESMPTDAHGRNSMSFQNSTENRIIFTREQIMSLPDLHGIWKFENIIVPFRLQYIQREKSSADFVPIKISSVAKPKVSVSNRPHGSANVSATNDDSLNTITNTDKNVIVSTSIESQPVENIADGEMASRVPQEPPHEHANEIRFDF
jgi:hypothetical protein